MTLVDTDIMVDLLRSHPPALVWLSSLGAQRLTIVGFSAMELLQGCWDAASLRQTEGALSDYDVIWPAATDYQRSLLRFGPRKLSHGLDAMDALIAETAIGASLPLHTFNTRHFAAYSELQTVQPYSKA